MADFRRHLHEEWLPKRAHKYFEERDPSAIKYLQKLLPSVQFKLIRDEWFDLAQSRKTSLRFDSRAYATVRTQINALIRFAYTLSPLVVIQLQIRSMFDRELDGMIQAPGQFQVALDLADSEALKKQIEDIKGRVTWAIIRYVLFTFPISSFLLLLSSLFRSAATKAKLAEGQANCAEVCFESAMESADLQLSAA